MTDAEIRRSVRRGVALLLVPVSLLLVQQTGDVSGWLPDVSLAVGVVLLGLATLYLVASGLRQLSGAANTPF